MKNFTCLVFSLGVFFLLLLFLTNQVLAAPSCKPSLVPGRDVGEQFMWSEWYWGSDYYRWRGLDNCNKGCSSNNDCPQNTGGSVSPDTSNWCYGFAEGNRCLQLQYIGAKGGYHFYSHGVNINGNCQEIAGWVCDPADYNRQVEVEAQFKIAGNNEPDQILTVTANDGRFGANDLRNECPGTAVPHGFTIPVPVKYRNPTLLGKTPVSIYIYGKFQTAYGGIYLHNLWNFDDNKATPIILISARCYAAGSDPTPPPAPNCPVEPISKPFVLTVSKLEGNRARISWEAVPGILKYALRIDNLADGWDGSCRSAAGDLCADVSGNSYDFEYNPQSSYRIWVASIHPCGKLSDVADINFSYWGTVAGYVKSRSIPGAPGEPGLFKGNSNMNIQVQYRNDNDVLQTKEITTNERGYFTTGKLVPLGKEYSVRVLSPAPPGYKGTAKTTTEGWTWNHFTWADTPVGSAAYEHQISGAVDCSGPNYHNEKDRCNFAFEQLLAPPPNSSMKYECSADGNRVTLRFQEVTGAQSFLLRFNAEPYTDWKNEAGGDFSEETRSNFRVENGQVRYDLNHLVRPGIKYQWQVQPTLLAETYPYAADLSQNELICGQACRYTGDINNDKIVNANDFSVWLNAFFSGDNRGDCDKNQTVDLLDFNIWRNFCQNNTSCL